MPDKNEVTALIPSVGADGRRPDQSNHKHSIPNSEEEINDDFENSEENMEDLLRKMRCMADPNYLHTVSMTELYQTSYKSRPPVIDGLLYAGVVYPCRSAEDRQVLSGSADCLPCQHRAKALGLCCSSGNGTLSCFRR